MRALGAVLIVLACGGIGFMRTGMLSRQIALLDTMCTLVRYLQTELCQRSTPLPDLFEQAGDSRLKSIAADLRKGILLQEAAQPVVQRIERFHQLPQSARTIGQLTQVLGRYDSATQAAACSRALEELEEQKTSLRRELSEKGALYRTAPLAFGLMAALAVL